ncbi:MAG: GNAT family protein [Pseudomonadota bacterium]
MLRLRTPDPLRFKIKNESVVLRCGAPEYASEWIAVREQSKQHLTRWEPDWHSTDITVAAVKRRIKEQRKAIKAGLILPLFVFEQVRDEPLSLGSSGRQPSNLGTPLKPMERLVGGVTLSGIKRHASHSAQIGYWVGKDFLRRGIGHAAVAAVVAHGLGIMGLNRIEAACQPENIASRRLLDRVGFRKEGLARDYLHINGAWRDHCLYAMTAFDLNNRAQH